MNTLENLFYGKIRPCDEPNGRDPEYVKLLTSLSENEEKLRAFLDSNSNTKEELGMLQQILDIEVQMLCFCELKYFLCGFRLGANIMLDTFITPQKSLLH